ncbi:MAG: ribokinase, partial [Chloroflexi bacterium]|nr:ribokinase [Chloroflexota bacterium]
MREQLLAALNRIAARRVMIVGDLALDEYLVGRATRLSREAAIPVLELSREFAVPGGAGNPAHNLVALGAHAVPVGVIGPDRAGEQLLARFHELRVDTGGIVADPSRPTTTKMRVMAEGAMPTFPQQVARLDRIERKPLSAPIERALIERIHDCAEEADALLVSDYRGGLVTPAIIEACRSAAHPSAAPDWIGGRQRLLTVDSQGDLLRFADFDLVRANRQEAEATLGRRLEQESDFQTACEELLGR